MRKIIAITAAAAALVAVMYWLLALPGVPAVVVPASAESIERGRYLVYAGGCIGCHEGTEHPASLSGGLALETQFGTFFAANITPDRSTGIGGWDGRDFLLALKHGRSPSGSFYFPAFPYLSYGGMTDRDALDIAAYLMSQPAVEFTVPSNEVPFWLSRWMLSGWNKIAALLRPSFAVETDERIIRGAYLARYLAHCGECHTPRNLLGIPDLAQEFSGAELRDRRAAAIDSEALAGWMEEDFTFFLFFGMKPDGDFVGGEMGKVIEHNTSKLTETDREALAAFFVR